MAFKWNQYLLKVGYCADWKQRADRDIHEGRRRSVSQRMPIAFVFFILITTVLIVLIRQVQGFQLPVVHCGTVAHRMSGDAISVTCIIWQCTTIALRWLNWTVCFIFLYLIEAAAYAPRIHTVLINKATRHQIRGVKGIRIYQRSLYVLNIMECFGDIQVLFERRHPS